MENDSTQKPRKRGLTSITLGWIAEKLRRAEKIKHDLAEGTYKVDSEKVAASLTGTEAKDGER